MSDITADSQIEGLETNPSEGWDEYPLDSVFVRTQTRTIAEVVKRIEQGRYILDPEFQRDFVWPIQKQSKLIESCMMRIPLPVFYVAEAEDGRIIVVDGLQRLTTFSRFIGNSFRLKGLVSDKKKVTNHPLEGKNFKGLSIALQERIVDTNLIMYILDARAPERARLDIFERVNGGTPLTRQQMRNAIYNGPGTKWLSEEVRANEFLNATGRSLDAKAMRDREAVNRFVSFRLLGVSEYKGDMDDFLARGISKLNKMSKSDRALLTKEFRCSMELNYQMFKKHAFRKSLAYGQRDRGILNISLFDAFSVEFCRIPEEIKPHTLQSIANKLIDLVNDDDFSASITYSTNDLPQVRTRHEMVTETLDRLF
jgi:hypothetical protein